MAVVIHFVVFCFLLSFVICMPMKTPCNYVKVAKILDCSNRGLSEIPMPGAKEKHRLVLVLDLRSNNITSVVEKYTLQLYPGLVMVDFRENPIDCTELAFSKVKLMVDCKSLTREPQTSMTLMPAMYKTMSRGSCYKTSTTHSATTISSLCRSCTSITEKRLILPISSLVKSSNISPFVSDKKTKIILLTTIIPLIIFIMLSIIIYGYCLRRQNTAEHNQNTNTFQIGSTTTIETGGINIIHITLHNASVMNWYTLIVTIGTQL